MPQRKELNARFKGYQARARRTRIFGILLAVVGMLVGTGVALERIIPFNSGAGVVVGSRSALKTTQLAAAASFPLFDTAATKVYDTLCPLFHSCIESEGAAPPTSTTATRTRTLTSLNHYATSSARLQSPPLSRSDPVVAAVLPEVSKSPATIVNQPIDERVRETERTVVESGTSAAYVNERMATLRQSLQVQIAAVAASANQQSTTIYQTLGAVARIENLDGVNITNSTISGGSIGSGSISGTISNTVNSLLGTIADLTSNTITATNVTFTNSTTTNATTTNLYVSGETWLGSGTGVLTATNGAVAALATGANGLVLKVVGGVPAWATDISGGGGSSAWATTTDSLAVYPVDTTDVLLVGNNATTTTGNILEVTGNSLFRGSLSAYSTIIAPSFVATSTTASVLPFASSTALTVSGTGYFGTASTTNLTVSGASGGLLKTSASGVVSVAIAGTDYLSATSGDWSGTFDGQDGSFYLANSFSTTSADVWQSTRSFFSTTSTNYFLALNQGTAFSTTSADHWESQQTTRTADDLTNNSIEDVSDVAAITKNYGDLFFWNGAAWADVATSSIGIALSDTTGLLAASRGGTGLSSITANQIMVGNSSGTGWTQVATSSLGLLTTSIAEGSNLYYLDSRVQSFVHSSTTIPKTYAANTFAALNQFSNASSSLFSVFNRLYVGDTATTTIFGSATSTFGAGIQSTYLNITGTAATSTFARGIDLAGGCFSINGSCVGGGSSGVGSGTQGQFAFYNTAGSSLSATSTLTLLQSGLLGIGTTSPLSKLDVYGDLTISGFNRYLNFGATSTTAVGTNGYGLRDNAGTIEFKNSGGTWQGVTTATTGPSFSVHKNGTNQTVTQSGNTKIQFTTEAFDTNNNFDSSTNYRFTPTVPGKYLITLSVFCPNTNSGFCIPEILKNGVAISHARGYGATAIDRAVNSNILVNMNGTSDYVEGFIYTDQTTISGTVTGTYMTGALIAPVNATAGGWQNDATQSFLADSTDKVGIGTTTPTDSLHIVDEDNTGIRFDEFNSSDGANIRLRRANGTIANPTGLIANDRIGAITAFGYDSSGAFGTAAAQFGMFASETFTSAAHGSYLRLETTPLGSTSAAERVRIDSNGNVGIGTTTPWRSLSVAGTVGFDGLTGATGAGSVCLDANKQLVYNSGSDACLSSTRATKHDITALGFDGLDLVTALEPVSFVYNGADTRVRYGFIAEDAAVVNAQFATYNASGTVSGIDDRAIISVIVKAIKEIWVRLEEYFARTERLEERVAQLEAQIAASNPASLPTPTTLLEASSTSTLPDAANDNEPAPDFIEPPPMVDASIPVVDAASDNSLPLAPTGTPTP